MIRVGSVVAHVGYQFGRGGSIPAPTLHFWIDSAADEAEQLVKEFHYSHRIPSNVQMVMTAHLDGGLFGNRGPIAGCVFYSIPPTRWSVPVLELSRLVRHPERSFQLSQLIAASTRAIRSKGLADLLVSFADRQQSHHGGIYQASGWKYDGCRAPSVEGIIVDGEFIPGRSANSRFGTRSVSKLGAMGIIAADKKDEGKHLYWKPLTVAGTKQAETIGLKSTPYPKPKAQATR